MATKRYEIGDIVECDGVKYECLGDSISGEAQWMDEPTGLRLGLDFNNAEVCYYFKPYTPKPITGTATVKFNKQGEAVVNGWVAEHIGLTREQAANNTFKVTSEQVLSG